MARHSVVNYMRTRCLGIPSLDALRARHLGHSFWRPQRHSHLNMQKLVFVVDDDPSMLKSAERLLKAHGCQAQVYASAEDFQQSAALDDGMCLIVDIHLSGKSGIELRRELTMSQVSLPVIFITGDDNEAIRSAAYSVGCVAFLTKPFSANSLLDAIQKARLHR